MTPGVDGKSLDGMSEKRINALIESLKDFSYHPNPARRVYIEKKNSTKKRPLGIPSTEDKLVQEVVKMILGSIYEPNFSDTMRYILCFIYGLDLFCFGEEQV